MVLIRWVLLVSCCWLTACDFPPMESSQQGFRGTGMVEIDNPEDIERLAELNPQPVLPPVPAINAGPKASEIYQNVQVLGDLAVPEFVALMAAITQWVSPEQSCNYCHTANFAEDDKYTKVVARRMFEMTRAINSQWKDHVADTGVNCYTCHRGKPVPEYIWFEGHEMPDTRGIAASRAGQNLAASASAYSSLPYDPFSALIEAPDGEVQVASTTALPTGLAASMGSTESTYGLMMHMSESLGVNCTYCHNSRAFGDWQQSSPARVTAWHGIRMARDLNAEYLAPLQPVYPANRLGPTGDAPKLNCSTCHQGVNKPLYGANMIENYPSLSAYFSDSDSLLAYTGMQVDDDK
jgi:photosynthetic reaction center cytochrome c subunit